MGRLFLVVAALVALLMGYFCLRPKKVTHTAREDARPPIGNSVKASDSTRATQTQAQTLPIAKSAMVEFTSWTEKYLAAATAAEKEALVTEGEELAKARLAEMYELIKTDPKAALGRAIPYEQRKRLPESIVSLLEQPVAGKGDYHVMGAIAAPGEPRVDKPVQRTVTLNDNTYDAYVYGRRVHQGSRDKIPVHVLSVSNIAAVAEDPVYVPGPEETADLIASGAAKAEAICSISKESSTSLGRQTIVRVGDHYVNLCRPEHARKLSGWLAASEDQWQTSIRASGPLSIDAGTEPPPKPGSITQGRFTLLFMRVRFLDDATEAVSEGRANAVMNGANQFFVENSYNTASIISTITPVLTLPFTKEWYSYNGPFPMRAHAMQLAREAGYDPFDYDLDVVAHGNVPSRLFDYGGLAFVSSRGIWLQGSGIDTGVVCHELGHNFGLLHANFLDTRFLPILPPRTPLRPPNPNRPSPNFPIDADSALGHDGINEPGEDEQYGDIFDTMGSAAAGANHFDATKKARLAWLPTAYLRAPTESSTNRLYAYDVANLTAGRTYALVIRKDFERVYWIAHRSRHVGNPWMVNGVELHFGPYSGTGGSAQLIDTTPGTGPPATTAGRQDAAVVVGRTFSDWQINTHITPIGRGGVGNEEWIDVVVHQGIFPDNVPPLLNLMASELFVQAGSNVTFTANASDANGDLLAYNWDFSDGTFGTNSSTFTRSFPTDGNYVVRCEVSDMKGGVTSHHTVITVGTPSTFTMSGQVIDSFANPLANVRVHNGRPTNENRYAFTDSDGYYTITDIVPGDYHNRGFLFNYNTAPLAFFNPVTIASANAVGLDHLAAPITKVSIARLSDGSEGGSNCVFEISRVGDTGGDLVVWFMLSGTALAGGDYEPPTENNVIIPAGQASTQLTLNTIADGLSDGARDVRVSLLLETNETRLLNVITNIGGTNQVIILTNVITFRGWDLINVNNQKIWYQSYPVYVLGTSEATARIFDVDDAVQATVSIFALDDAAVETGNDYANVIITRDGNLDGDITVHYTVRGVASNGVDYVTLPGSIKIPSGQTAVSLPVIALDDLFVEGNEVLEIELQDDPAWYQVDARLARLFIVDDDLPLVTVNATQATTYEASGPPGRFTVTRSGNLSKDLTVYYLVTGSAQNGVDYNALNPLGGDVIIPAGQVSANILVTPVDDSLVESNETVTLLISDHPTYNIGPPNSATMTIQDGSLPMVTLTANDSDADENGGTGQFTITRNGPATNSLMVNFEVGGSAVPQADYQAIGTNVFFPVGTASVTLNIVPQNDDFRETNETVVVTLVPGANYYVGNPNSGTVTIRFNDDGNLPEISFATRTSTVLESAGQALLTVRMSASIGATNVAPAIVEWRITGGSATFDVDYTLAATGYVIFDFDANTVVDIPVTINNDDLPEPPETLLVTLFHPNLLITNMTVTNGMTNFTYAPVPTNAFLGAFRTHTLTIIDDDSSTVSISAANQYAYEAGRAPAVITISREGSTNNAQTVHLAIAGTAANGSDYVTLPKTVVIPAGSQSVTLNVVPYDDPEEEVVETIWVSIVRAPGAHIGNDFVELYIIDNDGAIQFAAPEVHVRENQGVALVGVLRTGDTNLAASVEYLIQEGTATLNRDFFATNGILNFAPGETAKTIPITILDDRTVEQDETVFLYLTNATGGVPLGGQTTSTLFIDNDDASIQFVSNIYTVNENGGSAPIALQRLGITTATNTIDFVTFNLTATNGLDYTGVTNTVIFGLGETSKIVNVPIQDDFLFESNETVMLVLRNPSTNTITLATNAILVIVDDECALGFTSTTFVTNEYAPYARVIVSRTGGTVNPVSVDFATFDGTASNAFDYVSMSGTLDFEGDRWLLTSDGSGRLEFHEGDKQKSILIALLDDAQGEADETFQVRLSNARVSGAPPRSLVLGNGAPTNATVVILDNEGPGNVDYEHNPGTGADGRVLAVALQPPSSKAVFGGQFTFVNGIGFNRIARLNFDGSVDRSFNPGFGANQDVQAIATQPDGKIIIGGAFSSVDNSFRGRIARLNANGSLDTTFPQGSGANNLVRAIAVQPDGRILIAGDFTSVNGPQRLRVARLTADGFLDNTFQASINNSVNAIALQGNGQIIVGGAFTSVSGTPRQFIARLAANGALDLSFDPGAGANAAVNAVAVTGDGKVVLGGAFTGINGIVRNHIARLNADGSLDTLFDPGTGANGNVNTLALSGGGRVVVGGEFAMIDGVFLNRFARLKPDGKVDTLFDPGTGADGSVRALVLQGDGAIVMGGDFTVIDSIPRNHIARIHADEKSNIVGVEFLSAAPSVIENAGQVAITVLRSGNTNVPFSIRLIATNGTATAGADYVATNVPLSFAAGELSKSVNIRVLDDNLVESDEYVQLILTNGSPNVDLAGFAPGLLTILDNEQSFRFATNDFVALEDDGIGLITIVRDGFPAGTVSVEFRVQDGSATAPGDYIPTNSVLTFTNGEGAKIVAVQLTNDRQEEGNETAQLVLSNPTGAFLGNPALATLTIIDTDVTYGTFNFVSTNRITIFDGTPAVPYPSTINVSGLSGVVSRVEVTLSNLSHTFPDDIDILLVAPNGRSAVLMSDCGGSADAVNLTLRISDLAEQYLPNSTALTSGTNRPTDFEPGEVFPAPAPAGPYGAALNWLNGGSPNGDWKLFVRDDRGSDSGDILNGWTLHVTTVNPETITDVALGMEDSPDPLQAGELLTYTLSLTNLGPRLATGVKVTDLLPPDVQLLSAIPSQGSCIQSNSTITCDLGGIDVNGLAQITISVMPLVGASMTNTAFMTQDQNDIQVPNNSAVAITTVNTAPVADLVIAMSGNPDPMFAGQTLTYTINVTNKGPLNATGVVLTDVLPANVGFVSATTSQGQCGLANGQVSCNLGVLNNGSTALISILMRPMLTGKIINGATLSANEGDLTPAGASVETTVYPSADLAVSQTESQDPFPLGGVLTYTVTVTNRGPNTANGVNILDTLPANAALEGVLASQGSCYLVGALLICDFGVVSNGATASVAIDVRPNTIGLVQNSATVLAGDFDTVSANNTWTETTAVQSSGGGLVITPTINAFALAAALTGSGNAGLVVRSAQLLAQRDDSATSSGIFSVGSPPYTYDLNRPGIVLSTGDVKDYESGPNRTTNSHSYNVRATAAQELLLDPVTSGGNNNFLHFDATQLNIVFDLLPGFDRIEFKVVFGSEEYPMFLGQDRIDAFGIYLNGTNIALAGGARININHPGMRPLPGTELNAVLAPGDEPGVTFSARLAPGSAGNTLTIILGDTFDARWDTTVYISSLQGSEPPNADLAASIVSTPEPVLIGTPLTYTMTALNRGPDIATNVTLFSRVPPGMTYSDLTTSQGSCFLNSGFVTCFLNDLPRGSNAQVRLTVIPGFEGRVTNSVTVGSDLADLRGNNNTARVVSTIAAPGAFFNTAPIFIADAAPCAPYPSVINVSGMSGAVSKITVTLAELSHTFPADLDILLVSPTGQKAVLMSDVGQGNDVNGLTLNFDDDAAAFLPQFGTLVSGTYKPTNIGDDDRFYAPAPSGPYISSLSAFIGDEPNGPWSLYITDDQGGDFGSLTAGWRLAILTGPSGAPPGLQIVLRNGEVIISWPDPSPGYILEGTDTLYSGATWARVTTTPVSIGGRLRVNLPAGTGNQFFRLRKGSSP